MDTIDGFKVEPRAGHVEVTGVSESEVRDALDLFVAVRKKQRDAYVGMRDSLVAVMADSKVVSPQMSDAAQSAAAHRAALLGTRTYDYGELAQIRGVTNGAARSWVSRNADRIIAPAFSGQTFLPAFQFSDVGQLREHVGRVNAVLNADPTMDAWSRWAWWHSRTSFLSGESPLDVVEPNPDRALRAARRVARPNPA